eukprot:jgi/Galph1/4262/GphlegSOOS_G2883.1
MSRQLSGIWVVPGMEISKEGNFVVGKGAYILNHKIYASVLGQVSLIVDETGSTATPRLEVVPFQGSNQQYFAAGRVPLVGDVVIGKIIRVTWRAAVVEICVIEEQPVPYSFRGVIRLTDASSLPSDKTDMYRCFRVEDIVRGEVISLGDPQAYYLSTASPKYGVIYAKSVAGYPMNRVNEYQMVCSGTKVEEYRKVAVE